MMNYDKEKYKIWDWKHPMMLHWILNPITAIFELGIGISMPKIMLIERYGNKPTYKRTLIPCPHCNTLHSSLKWTSQNKTASENWYGYYCDNCGNIIPPLRNLFSLAILAITFPIWGWFRKSLKQNWLLKQSERYSDIKLTVPADKMKKLKKNWIRSGLQFGLIMYIGMEIVYPLLNEDEEITKKRLLIILPIYLICGLLGDYIMKFWINRFINKKGKTPVK